MVKQSPIFRSIGYARVSTAEQDLRLQLDELAVAGCVTIYREKESGAKSKRRELEKMLAALLPGDVVTVTRLDRLARSTRDLHKILERIEHQGAAFRSLKEPDINTTTPTGKLLLSVLAALADFERDLITSRTSEGQAAAKAQGVHVGRPPALTSIQQAEARQRLADGDFPAVIARTFGVHRSTISRLR